MGLLTKKKDKVRAKVGTPKHVGYRSDRANMSIETKRCTFCHHHKAISSPTKLKCSRCGKDHVR